LRNGYENKLKELTVDHKESTPITSKINVIPEISTGIPKSYEEIYQISVRNRQRNKDKKRERDEEPLKSVTDPLSSATSEQQIAAANACNSYFTTNDTKESDFDQKNTVCANSIHIVTLLAHQFKLVAVEICPRDWLDQEQSPSARRGGGALPRAESAAAVARGRRRWRWRLRGECEQGV
jgi:hypothetical protein